MRHFKPQLFAVYACDHVTSNRKNLGVETGHLLTLEAVRSIMVHFSSTALAAAIRAFFFSSFKSYG